MSDPTEPAEIDHEDQNFMDDPSYQKFIEWAASKCHCKYGPCEGVLAGGFCDGFDEEWYEEDEDFPDYNHEDDEW